MRTCQLYYILISPFVQTVRLLGVQISSVLDFAD
jgi:hypothetical protein